MVCDASERRLNSSARMCHRYGEAVTQATSLLYRGFVSSIGIYVSFCGCYRFFGVSDSFGIDLKLGWVLWLGVKWARSTTPNYNRSGA